MRSISTLIVAMLCYASPAAADFSISFTWGSIPSCTNGQPNTVASPRFVLSDVPAGTSVVSFRLVDLNVPGYNHGGGRVQIGGDGTIPTGAFRYKSPCPPNGTHVYEWQATAKAGNKTVGRATARRNYPE